MLHKGAPVFEGIITVWVMTWSIVWPALLLIILLALWALTRKALGAQSPAWALLAMLIIPTVMGVWAGANWAAEESGSTTWRGSLLSALAWLSVLMSVAILVRNWRKPGRWLLLVSTFAVLIVAAAIWFIGTMAIKNDWL
jgi:hypothetical protein